MVGTMHHGEELKRVVTLDTAIELVCPVEGENVHVFEWTKDGKPIRYDPRSELDGQSFLKSSRMRVTSKGSLKIKRVKAEDEGPFVCLASSNAFGRRQIRIILVVLAVESPARSLDLALPSK